MMSTSTQPICSFGGDFDGDELRICVQKNSKEGGVELCSYCKDTHPIIMYWHLERIAIHPPKSISKSMWKLIKSRKEIYLNMYKDQLERVTPGKHVCVLRQKRFRSDEGNNEWTYDIKNCRSDKNEKRPDKEQTEEEKKLRLRDYVICDDVDGEAELCAKCLSDLQDKNPAKGMFSEDGKHLLPKYISKGKEVPGSE